MPAANAFSRVCNEFVTRVGESIEATTNSIRLLIGPPAEAEKSQRADSGLHILNFFFYRLTPFEFDTDMRPDEVFRLRLHCMITPFGQSLDSESPTEHELRMLGDVLRILHEEPIMALGTFDTETVDLQITLQRPSIEELNHIWSTQPETTFRSSLIYEVALVPVLPSATPLTPALVGSTGVSVIPEMNRARAVPGAFAGVHDDPTVGRTVVATSDPSWAPLICFVKDGACSQVVRVVAGSPEATGFAQRVWVTGKAGAGVTLRWQTWTRTGGWFDELVTTAAAVTGPKLDPASPPGEASLAVVALPVSIQNTTGQAALVAERTYSLESERRPDGTEGPPRTTRSNLLLVVVSP